MRSLPILTYHSVSPVSTGELAPYTLAPALFAEHMRMLSDASYAVWSIDQIGDALLQRRPMPDRVVGLTFDDAFVDFVTEVLPVLADYDFGATLYIPTAHLGGRSDWLARSAEDRRPVLDADAIAALPGHGIECGSHSHTHPELDRLAPTVLQCEIARSKAVLEEVTGRRVQTFAYPYGYHSRRVRAAVRTAGYRCACGTGHEAASSRSDLFGLPRYLVYAGTSADKLEALLVQSASVIRHRTERAKQVAWRLSRAITRSDGGRAAADVAAKASWSAVPVGGMYTRRPGASSPVTRDAPCPPDSELPFNGEFSHTQTRQ